MSIPPMCMGECMAHAECLEGPVAPPDAAPPGNDLCSEPMVAECYAQCVPFEACLEDFSDPMCMSIPPMCMAHAECLEGPVAPPDAAPPGNDLCSEPMVKE